VFGIVWGDKAEPPVFSIFPAALLRTRGRGGPPKTAKL